MLLISPSVSSASDVISICRNGLNKPILDHQITRDTIIVNLTPDMRVLDVNIRIDTVLHTYDSDLRFYLGHLGTGVRFIGNVGLGGNNFIATNINDSASCSIGSSNCNLAPFSGTYRPTSPDSLYHFNYQAANGLWILAITDTFDMDEGVLKAWCITITYDNLLSNENNNQTIPVKFALYQNYPNPFNPETKIRFDIPASSPLLGGVPAGRGGVVSLKIYDPLGKEIATLINEQLQPGSYEIKWNASAFPSGIYFYRLESAGYSITKKMLIVK